MRPGNQSNKRMRGRGRKGPNPLTRTYESNGPDVKIRGTAMHVAEKYQQLARDAHASGDRVMSENYYQHAEHYLRIVAAAQPQQQPQQQSQQPSRNEAEAGAENASANGASPANGVERPQVDRSPDRSTDRSPERISADGNVVDANSPQPFIEDMPVIDQEGQVNTAGQKAEGEEADAEEKPRRRARTPRTPRTRAPRRASAETAVEDAPETAVAAADVTEAPGTEEEQPKPRRRTTRARKPKVADEAPAETAVASE